MPDELATLYGNLSELAARVSRQLEEKPDQTADPDAAVRRKIVDRRAELVDQTEQELIKQFHSAVADVAKGAIDRARDSAKFLQIAASAIATVYSVILGVAYQAGEGLPLRGVTPAVFLGLAIACSAWFLAFVRKDGSSSWYDPSDSADQRNKNRSTFLVAWVNSGALKRRSALQAGVVALGLGVAFMPAAFISADQTPPPIIAPAVPAEIAVGIEEPALRVYEAQVDSYFSALDAQAAEAAPRSCDHGFDLPAWKCAWSGSSSELDETFVRLTLWGLLAVALVPLFSYLAEKVLS